MKTKEKVTEPVVGMRFLHSRVLEPDGKTNQLFKITRIAQGIVYYRPVYSSGKIGKPNCCEIADFSNYFLELQSHKPEVI